VTRDNKKTWLGGKCESDWKGGRKGRREKDEVEMLRRRWKISSIPGV